MELYESLWFPKIDMDIHNLNYGTQIMDLQNLIVELYNYGFLPPLALNTTKQNKTQNFIPQKILTTTFHFLPLFSTCTCWY